MKCLKSPVLSALFVTIIVLGFSEAYSKQKGSDSAEVEVTGCPHLMHGQSSAGPGVQPKIHHLVDVQADPAKSYKSPVKLATTVDEFSKMNKFERLALARSHGPVVELSCRRQDDRRCFYVEDGNMAMALLKSSRKFPGVTQTRASSTVPAAVTKIIGGEIFLGNGKPWKNRRETLTDLFSFRHVESHQKQILEVLEDFSGRLTAASESGEELNLLEEMNALTFDIFLHVYLQKRNEGRLKEAFLSFRRMFRSINEELLAGKANSPSDVRKMMAHRKSVDVVNKELIEERRRLGFPNPEENLIDRLALSENEDGKSLSEVQMLGEMRTIYVASTDTTAWLLTQGIHQLIRHPQTARSLIREALDMERKEDGDRLGRNFRYTNAFVNEVLRLSPPFHTLSLSVDSDIFMENFEIPKGAVIYLSPDSLHSDPETWSEPETFLPERFFQWGKHAGMKRGCHIPFGGGERICLGQNLARSEAVLFFSNIARQFEFSCADGCEPREIRPSFIRSTSRDNPFRVFARERSEKGLETTYSMMSRIPVGGRGEGTWKFASKYQLPNEVVQPLFDNVYVPMGSEKKPEFDLFLVAEDGDEPMVVLGLVETPYGVRIDRVGHNNSRKALKTFSDFMSVRGINGLYMEIHGVPLVLSSRKGDMKIVPFEHVEAIQESEGVSIRRPTVNEIQQAIENGLLPHNEDIFSQSYIRIVNENGKTRERKIRVMVGRPYGSEED